MRKLKNLGVKILLLFSFLMTKKFKTKLQIAEFEYLEYSLQKKYLNLKSEKRFILMRVDKLKQEQDTMLQDIRRVNQQVKDMLNYVRGLR